MRVARLVPHSFRNLADDPIRFEPGLTVLHGPNGAGKTNVLEAVFFALTGRSCRTRREREAIAFGAADAGFSVSGNAAAQAAFDPRGPATFTLPGNGKASVFLGGRALPVNGQAAGSYTGTITFVVSYLGS